MVWLARLAKSKTIVFNVLSMVVLVFGSTYITQFISTEHAAEVVTAVNVLLRFVTSVPLSMKA